MNVPIKITLLSVAVVGFFAGAMSFYKTAVKPPVQYEVPDSFYPSVEDDIAAISDADGFDTLYVSISTSINFLADNELITPENSKELMSELFEAYVPIFCDRSTRYFKRSVWSESDLDEIRSHSKALSDKAEKENLNLSRDMLGDLATLRVVVNDYYAAKRVASVGYFRSLEHSKSQIYEARGCLKKPYLSNCTWLKNKLENVPKNLSSRHYDYLKDQVARLSPYRIYLRSEFESLYSDVLVQIGEYNSEARNVYGASNVESISDLRSTLSEYYVRAHNDTEWSRSVSWR